MTKEVQFRRGSTPDHVDGPGFTGALAEVTVDTTNDTLRVHDGSTKGGHELVGVAANQRVTNKDIVATNLVVSGVSTFNADVTINSNLNVTGNVSVAGSSFILNADQLRIEDKDIILAFTTTTIPNDNTANHAGVAVASTEGSFLIPLDVAGINTFPNTYKQMMWVKNGTMGAGTTDAWLFNNAVGVGSTLVPNNVYFAAGKIQATIDTLTSPNINVSGSVGIGTTNPTAKLEPVDTAANPSVAPVVFIQRPNNVAPASIAPTNADLRIKSHSSNFKIYAEDHSANPLMILTGSGNLGIGTTNPSTNLHVVGNQRITGTLALGNRSSAQSGFFIDGSTAGDYGLIFRDSSDVDRGIFLKSGTAATGVSLVGTNTANRDLGFAPGDTEKVRITSSGNVGIGSTLPTAKLDIAAGGSAASSAPIKVAFASTVMATPEAGAIEYDGTLFYATPNSSFGRAAIPTTLYASGTGTAGITLTTNYPIFPAANDTITLPVGTYLVRMRVRAAVAGSTVSSAFNINLRGGGTAVGSFSWGGTGAILDAGAASSFIVAATALGTNITVTAASTANPRQYIALGEGILKVTTGGTIIPSYQYAATLTSGTTTLVPDNYMIIQSLDSKAVQPAGPQGSGWG